jgi:hypothetical protein
MERTRAQWVWSLIETIWKSNSIRRKNTMAKNIDKLAKTLGASKEGTVPDFGGGAFGAASLANVLKERLSPGQGLDINAPDLLLPCTPQFRKEKT